MSQTFEYIIIGGGITGVSMGRMLQLAGEESFLILEGASKPGGLCRTEKIGAHYLDTGGGHFLCTKYPEVYDFVFSHIPREAFNRFARVSHIEINGNTIDYPLESNIWQLPKESQLDYLLSVLQNGELRGEVAPTNFEEWMRWKLGDLIAETYMIPYNRKIWGVEPWELDIDWLYKIPRLNAREILEASLSRRAEADKMPSHAFFYYPKSGGFQLVFDAILRPVEGHLRVDTPVDAIELDGDLIVVNGRFRAKNIIVTVPWRTIANSPCIPETIRQAINKLDSNGIVVSLHEEEYTTNAHWTYIPSLAVPHHRSFFIRNFAPHSDPRGLYRETNVKRWSAGTRAVASYVNDCAYPLPTLGWGNNIKTVLSWAHSHRIFGLGRWGQWQYFNSDVCIYEAMRLCRLLGHRFSVDSSVDGE